MSAWLIPALKAIVPHVGTIIGAAMLVFTRKTRRRKRTRWCAAPEVRSDRVLEFDQPLTLAPFQYRSEVETSGFFGVDEAACRPLRRANSVGCPV